MFLSIDFSNDLAIYEQIVRQVKFAVAGGLLKAGDLVPSVRDLARELTLNPNTVARAYRQLQSDGVLAPLRGTGLVVAEGSRERCYSERRKLISARVQQALAEAKYSGLTAEEIFDLVRTEWTALGQKPPFIRESKDGNDSTTR